MKARQFIQARCYNKRGQLLSVGFNSYTKTHPLQKWFASLASMDDKQYLHAEIDAILRARSARIHRIVVERYGKDGHPRLAAPCPICQLAIAAFGIKIVEHT